MVLPTTPEKYERFNTLQSKNLSVIVDISGADLLSSTPVYTKIRYGDVGVDYGDPGIVYGGLRLVGSAGDRGQQNILDISAGLTISQRLEPEQGRGAISTLSLAFIDKDGYMTELASPGKIVPDLLGAQCKIWLGYAQTSWPEDYIVVFRGKVTAINSEAARVIIQTSDANISRKKSIFTEATTILDGAITSGDTTINVISNGDFHKKIADAWGNYDTTIRTFLKIDDEFIEYQQAGSEATGFGVNQFVGVLRGARGSLPSAHADEADVEVVLEIEDHIIDNALKLTMSGFNGPWVEDISPKNFVDTQDISLGLQAGCIIFNEDVVEEYGLAVGDAIIVTGASNPANNGTFEVLSIADLNENRNRLVYTDGALVAELATPALASFRSQFDVYPVTCGTKIPSQFVDVSGHIELKNLFLGAAENSVRYFVDSAQTAKSFIENELFLPAAAYSLTRQGRISVGYSKPPLADQRLQILTKDNIINPQSMRVIRDATVSRKFYNEVSYYYDANDDGKFFTIYRNIDSQSLAVIDIDQRLPIKSLGTRTDLGFDIVRERRTRFLLQRYSEGAVQVKVQTNWEVGSLIEAGDVVALQDDGDLQLSNFGSGERDMGVQLFEVIDRQYNIGDGNVSLTLLGGLQGAVNDRYATFSPSSLVDTGSTTTKVRIQDSFGELFPNDEIKKWKDYVGLGVIVHSYDWSVSEETVITSLDAGDDHAFNVSPALSFSPTSGMIVDIVNYSTSTDPNTDALYKLVHCHFDPTVDVVSGASQTQFDVSALDVSKFTVGDAIIVHNATWSTYNLDDVFVSDITGNTITTDKPLGFTPSAGMKVELIGFADDGQAYRFV